MSGPVATHRNTEEPQPEFCDVCGTLVGGAHLVEANVEGLRGARVCDVTAGCRRMRAAPSYNDRKQLAPVPSATIGDSRVYPAGMDPWWED